MHDGLKLSDSHINYDMHTPSDNFQNLIMVMPTYFIKFCILGIVYIAEGHNFSAMTYNMPGWDICPGTYACKNGWLLTWTC